ncbi:MAG: beta-N-acetylhexosaminidase [Pseudomonadota bacterium]
MHSRGHAVGRVAFGATILDATGTRLSPGEKAFFASADPFGFILFARNIETPDQVRALTSDMRDAVGRDAPILIDQEGGRVQRMCAPVWRDWLPPLDHVEAAGAAAVEAMYLRSRIIADELRGVGVDANCAPLVDVAVDGTHAFLMNRCYGRDPEHVAEIGRAVADGLLAGGVLPVVKHMPGHGRATVDSHFGLPETGVALEVLTETDFAPFKALNDLPMGMTGHVVYSALDARPATLSPVVMGHIRKEIGFDGLIMTDDITMKALDAPLDQLAQDSLEAGCDVVLLCNASLEDRRRVSEAAGQMTIEAQVRAERAIAARSAPDEVDISALEAKLVALTA